MPALCGDPVRVVVNVVAVTAPRAVTMAMAIISRVARSGDAVVALAPPVSVAIEIAVVSQDTDRQEQASEHDSHE
jgi:hypothetical protein